MIQFCFFIRILSLKSERTIKLCSLINDKHFSVYIQHTVPSIVSLLIVHLNGSTQVVGYDGILSTALYRKLMP